jgi:hypothetical protein
VAEADPIAMLAQLLVSCGALIGRGAFFQVEATLPSPPNEFVWCFIVDSAKARKGSSSPGLPETLWVRRGVYGR